MDPAQEIQRAELRQLVDTLMKHCQLQCRVEGREAPVMALVVAGNGDHIVASANVTEGALRELLMRYMSEGENIARTPRRPFGPL